MTGVTVVSHFIDLFIEVNHGPCVIDNNIFLSDTAVYDCSQGTAFAHNLFAGNISAAAQDRQTPFHKEHSTEIAGLSDISLGDNRFYNNVFLRGKGLQVYDKCENKFPMWADGNVYLNKTAPCKEDANAVAMPEFDSHIKLVREKDAVYLSFNLPQDMPARKNQTVTGELLGKAKIPNLPYTNYDGSPLKVDTDFFGKARNSQNPSAGPFENPGNGKLKIKVWQASKGL